MLIETSLKIIKGIEDDKEITTSLEQILKLQTSKKANYSDYTKIWHSLSQAQQYKLATYYSKLNDLGRSERKQNSLNSIKAEHGANGSNADSIKYTIRKFRDENVPEHLVQKYIDEFQTHITLTGHPTNGTCVKHTSQGIAVENALSNNDKSLHKALAEYLTSDIVPNRKKTVAEEVQEAIDILNNLYDAAPILKQSIHTALDEYGYKNVQIRNPILNLHIWQAGDGDGNINADAPTLLQAQTKLQQAITQRYIVELQALKLNDIADNLANNKYQTPQQLIDNINNAELIDKINSFGFIFAKIDIRHDAQSLVVTLANLAYSTGLIEAEDFLLNATKPKLEHIVNGWLNNDTAIKKLQSYDIAKLNNEVAQRILGRLQIAAQKPQAHDKLIIAECGGAADALTALLLLKATGHEIANSKAQMNIVPLTESVEDLQGEVTMLQSFATNPLYCQHILALLDNDLQYQHLPKPERKRLIGKQIIMIADSDNRRRDGFGATQPINDAKGSALVKAKQANILLEIMDGGGASMMRGAQTKTTEIGFMHGYIASRTGGGDYHQPHFTTQGHQMRLLYSSVETASYMLEGIFSHAIYAKAGVKGHIPTSVLDPQKLQGQTIGRADARMVYDKAMQMFEHYKNWQPINNLLKNAGTWVSSLLTNVSSRSNERDTKDATGTRTVQDIRGNRLALEQRAITGDTLLRLSGILPLPLLGMKEGLQQMLNHGGWRDIAHLGPSNMYDNSKPERNSLRGLAVSTYMLNYKKAWSTLGIAKPSNAQIQKLHNSMVDKMANGNANQITDSETLAWFQQYSIDLCKLAYTAIKGDKPDDNFAIKDLLRQIWPSLAKQMDDMQSQIEFADAIQAELNKQYNSNPNMELSAQMIAIDRAISASTVLNNIPVGLLSHHTDSLHRK